MEPRFKEVLVTVLATVSSICAFDIQAAEVYYDRASFLMATGLSDTDDFSAYGGTNGQASISLTDDAMSAVRGETRFEALSLVNKNLIVDLSPSAGTPGYCSGCNGNFRLHFDATSLSSSGGVFGFGFDVLLHTSRYVSIGDDDPSNPTYPGGVLIQFADGSTEQMWIPPDVGYYDSNIFFFGLTDSRGIRSATVGTSDPPHFWIIDNLSIGAPSPVPIPAAVWLLLSGLAGLGYLGRRRKAA